jgi:adenosylmethionine-8-amino-7-oxononanoate aminotransferase
MNWIERDKKYVWHPFTQIQTAPDPIVVVAAKDASLIDADNKVYIDVNSSWWVNVHGHGNQHIGEAISKQFDVLDHAIFAGATHPKAIELAERVAQKLPKPLSKIFFSDDGSTSVEVALKMAFQYWSNRGIEKKRIVAIEGAYHGDTFGAMSVGQRGYFNKPFEHLFFNVDFIDFPEQGKEILSLNQLENLLDTGEIAALIVEPLVQGSAGMRMYSSEFLESLCALTKQANALLIFDEVMTGWGRTGRYFALNHIKHIPDIVCLSKGLTGGVLPLGLTVATEDIYNAFLSEDKLKALLHGHSFTGNALACAAACASMDLFDLDCTWKRIDWIEQQHADFLKKIAAFSCVHSIRQLGTIAAFDIQVEEGSSYFSSIRDRIYDFYLAHGVLLRPLGNVVFFNPPYCISAEELESVYKVTLELIEVLEKECT